MDTRVDISTRTNGWTETSANTGVKKKKKKKIFDGRGVY